MGHVKEAIWDSDLYSYVYKSYDMYVLYLSTLQYILPVEWQTFH